MDLSGRVAPSTRVQAYLDIHASACGGSGNECRGLTVVAPARRALRPVEGQRGGVEDGGQAGSSGALTYGVPDDGDALSALVAEGRGGEHGRPGQ